MQISEEEQPSVTVLHHSALKILYLVVMGHQWALGSKTFLKKRWYPRKPQRRKYLVGLWELVTLKDILKWATACETVQSLKEMWLKRVKGWKVSTVMAWLKRAQRIKVQYKNSFPRRGLRMAWNLQFEVGEKNGRKRKNRTYLQKIFLILSYSCLVEPPIYFLWNKMKKLIWKYAFRKVNIHVMLTCDVSKA